MHACITSPCSLNADVSQDVHEMPWSVNIQDFTIAVMILEPNNATLMYSCTATLKLEDHMAGDKCAIVFMGDNNTIVLASNPVT